MHRFSVVVALTVISMVPVGTAHAQIRFDDISKKSGIADEAINAAGPSFVDYDNDGDTDIYVSVEALADGLENRLWENDGNGNFTDVAAARGVDNAGGLGRGVGWGDYDNDGDWDLVVANMPPSGLPQGFTPTTLYKNLLIETGVPNFEDITRSAGLMRMDNELDVRVGGLASTSGGVNFVDYDQDGDLDILWRSAEYDVDNELFRNDGNDTFTRVTEPAGISMVGKVKEKNSQGDAGWTDFNNDGIVDLLSPNEGDRKLMFLGNGDGTFTDITLNRQPPTGLVFINPGNANGVCLGDIENDGDMDVYFPMADQANRLYRNDFAETGALTFTDTTLTAGADDPGGARGCTMADYDNDGYLDIYVNNGGYQNTLINDVIAGFPPFVQFYIAWEQADNVLYLNNGDGTFRDATRKAGVRGRGIAGGVASGDINDDGFPDIFVTNRTYYSAGKPAQEILSNVLYLNRGNDNNWIKTRLVGTQSNRSAINARVRAVSDEFAVVREVLPASGYNSMDDPTLIFGLGRRDKVDYLEVTWPSGVVQRIDNPEIRTTVEIVEPQ